MANKKVSQLTSKPSVLVTDLFPIADPSTGQLYKTTISDLGTAIGSGVSSVNTLVGAVVLDTDDIQELVSPTNKWFTDTRARAALSASSPLAYNSGTGVFSIQVANGSQNGYLSSTDWTTFNSKQAALSGTGFVKISGTTISYDNSTYALDSAVVKLTGDQTVAGQKKFTSSPLIDIDLGFKTPSGTYTYLSAFNSGWNLGMTSGIFHSFYFGSTTARSYTFPNATGTVALTSDLSIYALDSAVVKLTGSQTVAGLKTFSTGIAADVTTGGVQGFASTNSSTSGTSVFVQNSNVAIGIGIANVSTGLGISIGNDNSGKGIYISNATVSGSGKGISIDNYNGGTGIEVGSDTTADAIKILHISGRGLNVQSSGAGYGLIINNSTASTSVPFTIQKQGATKISFTDAGAATFSSSITAGQFYSSVSNGTNQLVLQTSGVDRGYIQASNSTLYLNSLTGNDIQFQGNGSTKMIITSAGNVGIGTTAPLVTLDIVGRIRNSISSSSTTVFESYNPSSTGYGAYISGGTSGNYAFRVADYANNVRFTIDGGGAVLSPFTYSNTTANLANMYIGSTGTFERSVASSIRFKEHISEWGDFGLSTILSLKPKTFTYKEGYYSNPKTTFLGLIAEEVAEVSPYLADFENEDRTGQVENVRYANIVVPLIKAVQELKAELDALKA